MKVDYSKYKCPYSHLKKDCGHKLKGPQDWAPHAGVWCACGFRGPVFYVDPEELGLELIEKCKCHCESCEKQRGVTND